MKASRAKAAADNSKMNRREYEKELRKLQVGLCRLQIGSNTRDCG